MHVICCLYYRSLRRTTAEIQNYEFERLERATTSKDSGISNMADIEERIEGLALTNSVSLLLLLFHIKNIVLSQIIKQ